jgi:hypothetical protein
MVTLQTHPSLAAPGVPSLSGVCVLIRPTPGRTRPLIRRARPRPADHPAPGLTPPATCPPAARLVR